LRYSYDRRDDTPDPKRVVQAVEKALEQMTGLEWSSQRVVGPRLFRNHENTYSAKFYSKGETFRDIRNTNVHWYGSGKFATITFEGRRHDVSLSGTNPRNFEDPRYLQKSLESSRFEPA
jgi:hypothetical protein